MDYNKLLDEWAEIVLEKAMVVQSKNDDYEFGTYKYGLNKGYAEGLRMATAILSRLEQKYKKI